MSDENDLDIKKTKPPSLFVVIIMALNGCSALVVGIIYYLAAALADPLDFKGEFRSAMIHQEEMVALLSVVYLIACFVSVAIWRKRRSVWRYLVMGLGLLHLAGASYLLLTFRYETTRVLVYLFGISLVMNLLLLWLLLSAKTD